MSEDDDALLNALADGELDAASALALERRLEREPALAARLANLRALHAAIRAKLPLEPAPDALRRRVAALAPAAAPRRPAPWMALAASLALGAALGAGAMRLYSPSPSDDPVARDLVASYMRARLAAQPIEVASADRHTVKPWLATKIAAATNVPDLAADGFALLGGRVDVVAGAPVATLVYQRREHAIALSELPLGPAVGAGARDGFALLRWSDASRSYAAVSDLAPSELEAFAASFRRVAAQEK